MPTLWTLDDPRPWQAALDRYPEVVGAQGVARLEELDRWYREELGPELDRSRSRASARKSLPGLADDATRGEPAHLTLAELVRLTEWKMARGVWRAPNLVLVRGNDEQAVVDASREAFAAIPHPTRPIKALAALAGVGPATASAAMAAAAPETYPFFDELVAGQVPSLGKVAWTIGYYARYAEALRERASALGDGWTPVMVERAVWSSIGGKAGIA